MKHAATPPRRLWRARGKTAGQAGQPDRVSEPDQAGQPDQASQAEQVSQPERASRAGAGRRWLASVPYWILLGGAAAALLTMRQDAPDARGGTLVLAGVLLVAGAARLMLPERRAGLLGSRRRLADVAAFAVLGTGLLVVGLLFPVPA